MFLNGSGIGVSAHQQLKPKCALFGSMLVELTASFHWVCSIDQDSPNPLEYWDKGIKLRTYIVDSHEKGPHRPSVQFNSDFFQVSRGWAIFVSNKDFIGMKKHDNRLARMILGRDLTQGEVGVALAHQGIYKDHLSRPDEWVLIMEDDAIVDEERTINQIRDATIALQAKKKTAGKAAIILLGYYSKSTLIPSKSHLLTKQCTIPTGTFGYLINRAASERLWHKQRINFLADWPLESVGVDFYTVNIRAISHNGALRSIVDQPKLGPTRVQANLQRDGKLRRLLKIREVRELKLVWHFIIKRGMLFRLFYPWAKRLLRIV